MRRILSIDGGGIKGVMAASFLASLEESLGTRVSSYFDLIVGTSTGGIIALGLGVGLSASEILGFYRDRAQEVFEKRGWLGPLRWLGLAKYDAAGLKGALQATFGERRLGESSKRLVIPALNIDTGEVHIYKTAHHPKFERDQRERVVDVGLATAAAPSYFPVHRSASGIPLVDGGMWANNPVGVAVVEAVGVLEWPRHELRVLSLGCTAEPLTVSLGIRYGLGVGYWMLKAVDVMMAGQSSAALGTAKLLAGHENVVRICPPAAPGRFKLDVLREIESLRGLGDSEARKALPRLREMFFSAAAEPFEPHRKP